MAPACSMSVTDIGFIGRHAAIPAGNPRSSSMAGRVPVAAKACGGTSIPRAIGSFCSISAARAEAGRMPVSRISISPAIRRRICWRISSGCGSVSASSDGWSSACPGDRLWRSLMPSSIPSASAKWACQRRDHHGLRDRLDNPRHRHLLPRGLGAFSRRRSRSGSGRPPRRCLSPASDGPRSRDP